MDKKKGMPAFFALAFVWFTTHFGGGFASGAQVIQYFITGSNWTCFIFCLEICIRT